MYQFRTPVRPAEGADQVPDDEPFDEGPLKTAKAGVVHAFLVLLAVIVFIAGYIVWEHRQTEQIVAQQPIGSLIGMTGIAGRGWPIVIETQLGFFPLRKAISISPGTPLLVEERASGKRFVCDLGRTLCVQTSAASFSPLGHIQDKDRLDDCRSACSSRSEADLEADFSSKAKYRDAKHCHRS